MAHSVGIKDVARAAGVSVGTVSNVINRPDTVATETRARVLSAIDRLGYVRGESARQLRARHAAASWASSSWTWATRSSVDVARGAERAPPARPRLGVMVCNSAPEPAGREEAEYPLRLFAEQRVRGVLLARPTPPGRNIEGLPAPRTSRFVLVGSGSPRAPPRCSVSVDDVAGGALGRAAPLWTPDTAPSPTSAARPASTRCARPPHRRPRRAAPRPDFGPDALRELPTERLDVAAGRDRRRPPPGPRRAPDRAVFCANDLLALRRPAGHVRRRGRRPGDAPIVGYDDIEVSPPPRPVPLTSRAPAHAVAMGCAWRPNCSWRRPGTPGADLASTRTGGSSSTGAGGAALNDLAAR